MKELAYGYRGFYFIAPILTIFISLNLVSGIVELLLNDAITTETIKAITVETTFSLIIFALCLLYFYFKTRRKRRLLKKGICYDAKVIDCEYDKNIAFHGTRIVYGWSKNMPHPFKVTVRYENEFGTILIDESKLLYYNISTNPENFKAKVWVNQEDSSDRYIQLFLIS